VKAGGCRYACFDRLWSILFCAVQQPSATLTVEP